MANLFEKEESGMPNTKDNKKKMTSTQRRARLYQVIFVAVTIIVLLSMLLTSFMK